MNMILDQNALQLSLDGETDIIVRRDFTHPPSRVWRALTDPALIPKWMASQDAMKRCEVDLRPGGSFLYEWEAFYFSGPILEADAPHRMVHVEHFNGDTSSGPTVTTTLTPQGSGTRLMIVHHYADEKARAAAMEGGFLDGFDEVYAGVATLLDAEGAAA